MTEFRIRWAVPLARFVFIAATVLFAWWGIDDRWSEVSRALRDLDINQIVVSVVLVIVGLLAMRVAWNRIMSLLGYPLPAIAGSAIFFLGQLGKYLPGSLWHLAAQGEMARRYSVPVRTTVTAGLLLVYWLSVTAVLVTVAVDLLGWLSLPIPIWITLTAALAALMGCTRRVNDFVTRLLSGSVRGRAITWHGVAAVLGSLGVTWIAFGSATAVLSPPGFPLADVQWWGLSTGAFSLAFVVGLLIPLLPAGAGIREALLVTSLSETLGTSRAVALAIGLRAIHAFADFLIAGISWTAMWSIRRICSPASE